MEFGRFEVDHDGFGAFQPLRAVFDGRYKLSVNLMSTDELYDLEKTLMNWITSLMMILMQYCVIVCTT